LLALFGVSPRFTGGGHGAEVVCGLIGIAIVLAAGSIWRKRKLQGGEHAASHAADEAAQTIDRP
jgi:hypothetical protein